MIAVLNQFHTLGFIIKLNLYNCPLPNWPNLNLNAAGKKAGVAKLFILINIDIIILEFQIRVCLSD